MLILLPPSETKRNGGVDDATLDLASLGFPSLTPARRAVIAATRKLSRNRSTMAAALHLGPSQHWEVLRNRTLRTSPTMPALDRYTGVVYDALDTGTMDAATRTFADEHVVIHSAMFGLVRASDHIPAYRLSHDSRLPDLSLKRVWRDAIASELAAQAGLVLDLRSEAYVQLGPAPGSSFIRVVARGADGRRRALNHFNKKGKGEFVRAIIESGIVHPDADSLLSWATTSGVDLVAGAPGELELAVDEVVAGPR